MPRPGVSYLSKEIPQRRPKASNQEGAEDQQDEHFTNDHCTLWKEESKSQASFQGNQGTVESADEGRFPTTRWLPKSSKALCLFLVLKH